MELTVHSIQNPLFNHMLITDALLSFWNNRKSQNGLHMQHTSPKADVLQVQTGMLEFFQNEKEEKTLLRAVSVSLFEQIKGTISRHGLNNWKSCKIMVVKWSHNKSLIGKCHHSSVTKKREMKTDVKVWCFGPKIKFKKSFPYSLHFY